MDACMGLRFAEQGQTTRATLLGRDAGESATPLQSVLFDDIDDWNGYFASPPDDPWGLEIGQGDDQGSLRDPSFRLPPGYLRNWYVSVAVCYADSSDFARVLPAGETSAFRAVIVSAGRVETNGTRRLLAELRRVCGDVATP
jgi:hypothetical protein